MRKNPDFNKQKLKSFLLDNVNVKRKRIMNFLTNPAFKNFEEAINYNKVTHYLDTEPYFGEEKKISGSDVRRTQRAHRARKGEGSIGNKWNLTDLQLNTFV